MHRLIVGGLKGFAPVIGMAPTTPGTHLQIRNRESGLSSQSLQAPQTSAEEPRAHSLGSSSLYIQGVFPTINGTVYAKVIAFLCCLKKSLNSWGHRLQRNLRIFYFKNTDLAMVTVVVMKCYDQSSLGRKEFIWLMNHNPSRESKARAQTGQEPGRRN